MFHICWNRVYGQCAIQNKKIIFDDLNKYGHCKLPKKCSSLLLFFNNNNGRGYWTGVPVIVSKPFRLDNVCICVNLGVVTKCTYMSARRWSSVTAHNHSATMARKEPCPDSTRKWGGHKLYHINRQATILIHWTVHCYQKQRKPQTCCLYS